MDELALIAVTMDTQEPILPVAYKGPRKIIFPLHEIVIVNKEVLTAISRRVVGATAPRIAPLLSDRLMWGP